MGKIKLTTLGSMGWIPTRNRHTCCYCLEYDGQLIIFDAGTGLARLDEPWGQEILNRYEKVLLVLSHYHMDHVAGLIYLPFFFKEKEVHIAGPGKSIYGQSVKDILSRLISPPYFGRPLPDFPMNLEFHDLGTGPTVIAGINVETLLQEHSDPSIGIKIDHAVCYMTDTVCNRSTVEFAAGCKLLLHETWFDLRDYTDLENLKAHSPVNRVAEAARDACVHRLLLVHLNPGYDENRLLAMERDARQIFPASFLAREGVSISPGNR